MKLSAREKRSLTVGASVALCTAMVAWVIAPLWREWRALGRELAPKAAALRLVEQRVERRAQLLALRARLTRELGSLCGSGQDDASGHEDAAAGSGGAAARESSQGQNEGEEKAASEPSHQAGRGARAGFESELERLLRSCGARLKQVSAQKTPASAASLKHFRMVRLQVQMQADVSGLVKVLHGLEKGARFARVDSLKIHRDLNRPGALEATLIVVAYEPVAPGGEGGP